MAMLNVVVSATAPLFTLEEAKAHLVVETAADDGLIETYSNAAVSHLLQYCNLSIVPMGDGPVAAFRAAALMLLGDLYLGRTSEFKGTSRYALLVDPYRNLRV